MLQRSTENFDLGYQIIKYILLWNWLNRCPLMHNNNNVILFATRTTDM